MSIYLATGANGMLTESSGVMKTIKQIKGTQLNWDCYIHVDLRIIYFHSEQGNCGVNASGRWILEAKIHSYKLYTQSFLSLLMSNGWFSDEVSAVSILHTYTHQLVIVL